MGSRKALLTQLVQDAVLKLCTQNLTFDNQLEIDGIICVSQGEMAPEVVIKMHRTIMKPEQEPQPQWADTSMSDLAYEPQPSPTQHTPRKRVPPSPQPRHRDTRPPSQSQQAYTVSEVKSEVFTDTPQNISGAGLAGTSGDSNSSYGAYPEAESSYGETPRSGRKRKPPDTPAESNNKAIKVETEPIMIEDDGTTEQAYMAGGNSEQDQYIIPHQTFPKQKMPEQYPMILEQPSMMTEHPLVMPDQSPMMPGQPSAMGEQSQMTFDPSNSETWIVEAEEQFFQCSKCDKLFPSNRCVEYHSTVVHNGFCDVCNKRIEIGDVTHSMSHRGEKPFQCHLCYKLFTNKITYKLHTSRDLKCLICSKEFPRQNKTGHVKSHLMK